MKSVALHNLGCKVNAYETDIMRQNLLKSGYRIVSFEEKADIYIVNTCTVTNIADRKSRQMLHRAKKQNPDAVIVAAGCYAQAQANKRYDAGKGCYSRIRGDRERENGADEEIMPAAPDPVIDIMVGNERKGQIVRILEEYFEAGAAKDAMTDIALAAEYEEMQLRTLSEHTRAYVKIQDGCNQFCSYCAIPYARGRVRSRSAESVLEEVKALADGGCREAVLTGIHLSSYGLDFLGIRSADYRDACKAHFLTELIGRIADIEGIERIRLGSLEPRIITEDFVKRLSVCDKLCPHFHLSLQSGCDETLGRMNRHYDTRQFQESAALLRAYFPNAALTTDVIVGFPGETEEEFEKSVSFLEKIRFYEMHVFKYSRREGTVAAGMKGQVPDEVKDRRSERLIGLAAKWSRAYRERLLGQRLEILTEEWKEIGGGRYLVGHTKNYVLAAVAEREFCGSGSAAKDESAPQGAEAEKNGAGISVNEIVTATAMRMLTDEIILCGS